jgi:hypothetical protein
MRTRLIAGFLIAPIFGPLTLSFILAGMSILSSFDNFLEAVVPVAAVGIPVSYLIMLLFGVPTFLILRKCNSVSVLSVCFMAAFIPPLIMFMVMMMNAGDYSSSFLKSQNAFIAVGVSGFVTALLFWIISFGFRFKI